MKLAAKPKSVRSVQQQKDLKGWTYEDGKLTFNTSLEWADHFLIAK